MKFSSTSVALLSSAFLFNQAFGAPTPPPPPPPPPTPGPPSPLPPTPSGKELAYMQDSLAIVPTEKVEDEYEGAICTGEVQGELECGLQSICDTEKYQRWKVYLKANQDYTIGVARKDCALDPVMEIVRGTFSGEYVRCISNGFDTGGVPTSADDENLPFEGCVGLAYAEAPFGDPLVIVRPEHDGIHTITVTGWCSADCDNGEPLGYTLTVDPAPELEGECESPSDSPSESPADGTEDGGTGGGGEEEDAPSPAPSAAPFAAPSASPTAPTGSPTSSPSASPTQCNDKLNGDFPVFADNVRKTCAWLTEDRLDTPIQEFAVLGDFVEISETLLGYDGDATLRSVICAPEGAAYTVCPETCGECSDVCTDATVFYFGATDADPRASHLCAFLRVGDQNRRNIFCERSDSTAATDCPESCGTCS